MMSPTWLALSTALLPLVVGAILPRLVRASAEVARRAAVVAAAAALAGAASTGAALFVLDGAPQSTAFLVFDPDGLGAPLSVYVDTLTCIMLVMISVVGVAVSQFSVRYLDGDPRQARFTQWLSFTLSAALLLVVAGNLIMLWLAWVASSVGLHKLLTFYEDRPAARLAAKKKFVISRVGDALLLFGFLIVFLLFGSTEYRDIFAAAEQTDPAQPWATLAGVFLVLGAMTKSAQLPVHSWLPDTMETPTPVSALMHAGLINAGGFMLVRLSPFLVLTPLALDTLLLVGALTATFAGVVMLTQTDIKRKLAYSTVAQMGFMMLQIGLGAFSLAVLHIVGHSFYKAHAFLSASSTVEPERAAPSKPPGLWGSAAAFTVGATLVFGLGAAAGSAVNDAGHFVLHAILALAVAQLVLSGASARGRRARGALEGLLAGLGIAAIYLALGGASNALLDGVLAPSAARALPQVAPMLVFGLFTTAYLLQSALPSLATSVVGHKLYALAYNGLYFGAIQDRFVERLWPDHERTP